MRVHWSAAALARRLEIETHIAGDDPVAVQQLVDGLIAATDALDRFPQRGRMLDATAVVYFPPLTQSSASR